VFECFQVPTYLPIIENSKNLQNSNRYIVERKISPGERNVLDEPPCKYYNIYYHMCTKRNAIDTDFEQRGHIV